jgi:hypothetical protein
MDEKLHAVICPHPPLALPNLWSENHFEIDPIRIDPIIYSVVRFDPVSVYISRVGLLGAKASVDDNLLNASGPKCSHGGPQALQKPTPPRSEPEPGFYFFQRCPMITGRQGASRAVESRNHPNSIMSGTNKNVNMLAVIGVPFSDAFINQRSRSVLL